MKTSLYIVTEADHLGGAVLMSEKITKWHEEGFGIDGDVHFCDCGNGFTSIYLSNIN